LFTILQRTDAVLKLSKTFIESGNNHTYKCPN